MKCNFMCGYSLTLAIFRLGALGAMLTTLFPEFFGLSKEDYQEDVHNKRISLGVALGCAAANGAMQALALRMENIIPNKLKLVLALDAIQQGVFGMCILIAFKSNDELAQKVTVPIPAVLGFFSFSYLQYQRNKIEQERNQLEGTEFVALPNGPSQV